MDDAERLRRRDVTVAGHTGDVDFVLPALDDPVSEVRVAAVGAAERCGVLTAELLNRALEDEDQRVRLRAIDVAASRPGDSETSLLVHLRDSDEFIVERAAWASGERQPPESGVVPVLAALVTDHAHKLVREAAVASLGAIGDPAALKAILAGTRDVATIRRRAVLALAPFDGDAVTEALERALDDRDWQTRQAAADVLGVEDVRP